MASLASVTLEVPEPAAAKNGTGSHPIVVRSGAGPFIDPDGFVWEDA